EVTTLGFFTAITFQIVSHICRYVWPCGNFSLVYIQTQAYTLVLINWITEVNTTTQAVCNIVVYVIVIIQLCFTVVKIITATYTINCEVRVHYTQVIVILSFRT